MKIQSRFGLLPVLALLVGLLVILSSCGQARQKSYVIGVVNPNKGSVEMTRGFIEGLAEYGYKEGENTTYILHENSFEVEEAVNNMVARDVDLIFSVTTPATKKAKAAAEKKGIPVVFAMQDPVASGLTKSLSHPNGNLTGIQIRGSVPKGLHWLLSTSPGIKNVYVPIKYDTKAAKQSLADLQEAAESFGVKLVLVEINDQVELESSLAAISDDVDAIFILCSIFVHCNVERIVEEAVKRKLPIGSGAAQCDRGVTISYGMVARRTGKQASRLAHLVLQGTAPGNVPSELSDFYLGVNLKTARASGVEVPSEVLSQADFIVR